MTIWAVRLWERIFSVPCCPLYRELLGGLERSQIASMAASFGASNRVPCRRRLQAVRASLLASAMAALFRGIRATASVSHGPKLQSDHRCGRIMITFAACTNNILG